MLFYFILLCIVFLVGLPLVNILTWKLSGPVSRQHIYRISHRGAAGLAPENTLEAVDAGLKHAVDYIEIDIHQTLDQKIVVIHDKTVNRTTNGKGLVHTLKYAEIEKLNASLSFPGYGKKTKIPLLGEVLTKIKETNTGLLIEIKDPSLYPGLASRLASIIRETGTEKNVMIFSFDQDIISEVKRLLPAVPTGFFFLGIEKIRDGIDVLYVSPNWITLLYFPWLVKKLHNKGYKVFVWTVDAPFVMRYLTGRNVDGIITNRPDLLNKSLRKLNVKP